IPMILSGDEFANTQFGNNNAYCQDNEISWLNWNLLKENQDIFNYFQKMIEFRKEHPVLRTDSFDTDYNRTGYPEISWHGVKLWEFDPAASTLTIAALFAGPAEKYDTEEDQFIYAAINMHWEMHGYELPNLPRGKEWHIAVNTDMESPEDIWSEESEPEVKDQNEVLVSPRSIILLVAK
ncbi:MAG: glycogen debranching enzyme, partial [Halanaerobacter sp.]